VGQCDTDMTFAREVDLCSAFLTLVPDGWLAYAETGGFDILVVREKDGFQIGVQAKLRLNAKVICQALETGRASAVMDPNPDCRAVLVPKGAVGADMARVCAHLGLTVIALDSGRPARLSPDLPRLKQDGEGRAWFEQGPSRRISLPALVPDVVAGAPAPRMLTAWKIRAMRIAVTLEREGRVVREDFKHHKVDIRRWIAPGSRWLVRNGDGWSQGPGLPDFQAQHPRNWSQIAEAYHAWRRSLPEVATTMATPLRSRGTTEKPASHCIEGDVITETG
jgi:hypothetical protein